MVEELRGWYDAATTRDACFVDDRGDHLVRTGRAAGPIRTLQPGGDHAYFRQVLSVIR